MPKFSLNTELLAVLDDMPDENAGMLFKAVKQYLETSELPSEFWLQIAIKPFVTCIQSESQRRSEISARRSEVGRKGGLAKAGKTEPKPEKIKPKKKEKYQPSKDGAAFAEWFLKTYKPESANINSETLLKWASVYDDLITKDKKTKEDVVNAVKWAKTDEFWKTNFLSPLKLRTKNKEGIYYIDVFIQKAVEHLNSKKRSKSELAGTAPLPGQLRHPITGEWYFPDKKKA